MCIGLALVGMSGLLKKKYETDPCGGEGSASVSGGQMLVGIFLVLLASALNAIQNVFEEKLLKAGQCRRTTHLLSPPAVCRKQLHFACRVCGFCG